MAKGDDNSLLKDISSQLKRLNQTSNRNKLQEKEANERQEAIFQGATLDGGGFEPVGDGAFIGAGEDFKRRFVASTAGMYRDLKFKPSEKEAEEELRGNWFAGIHRNTANALHYLYNIETALIDYIKWYKEYTLDQNRSDEERRREKNKSEFGPGQNPNSIATRIKKGWNADESELDTPQEEKKSWFSKLLGYPKTAALWVITAVGTALYDTIKGWETGGVTGAIAAFFGGTEEGGWKSGIKGAFKGVGIGIATGFMVGGPIGAIAGGIIGGVGMAITGSIGSAKIKDWLDEAKKNLGDSWSEIKTNWNSLMSTIGNWIYTPGEGSAATGGFKSRMFGTTFEWNPTKESGETLSSAWLTVVAKMEAAPGIFAKWFEGKVRAKFGDKLGDILFGDSPETIAKKKLLLGNPHIGEAIITKSLQSILRDEVDARIDEFAARGDVYTGLGSPEMNELILRAGGENVDADGNVIGNAGDPGGVIEGILDSNRESYLSIGAYRARMQAITEASIPDYSKPTILYDDKSDKSTTTTIINTSTYIDTGTAEILGSGNNSHEVVTPDGTIYSW
tara:strand:- start:251 stop:1942 length:1692 start_codon:yes stop_codon:yes gene_type:complete